MGITYANTEEIESIANELISLSNEYNSEINSLFNRMIAVPTDTKEWTGTQAKKYSSIIAGDKAQFLEVGKQLKYIGDKIKSDASEINSCINDCNNNEAKRGY